MIWRAAALGFALAVALCACTQRPEVLAPKSDVERVADDVIGAIEKNDMTPVLSRFVPERRSELTDPAHVRQVHDVLLHGEFLGAREVPQPGTTSNTLRRYFIVNFANGRETLMMTYDDSGKIVHLRLTPAPA